MILAEKMGERVRLREQPAERARVALEFQVVIEQIGPERKPDREADEIDVERQENDAQRERSRRGRGGVGRGMVGSGHGKRKGKKLPHETPRSKRRFPSIL